MAILITGGLGYIGSHIVKCYGQKDVVIIDNQSNNNLDFKEIFSGINVLIDDLNLNSLNLIFRKFEIDSVIHLAGLKSVGESIEKPNKYYRNNVNASLDLLESMDKFKINKLIFSSSATVYGDKNESPLSEDLDTYPLNPYGETKIIIENMIKNYSKSNPNFASIVLRYFNPIGADKSGKLFDNPLGKPQNLMPLIIQSIIDEKTLKIFGNNYDTEDGTCIRDYIHVLDLANSHLMSLKYLDKFKGFEILNVGMGRGISVLELIEIFMKTNNLKINFEFTKRRIGDAPVSFASNRKIKELLKWSPKYSYEDMCKDSWYARQIKN